MRQIGLPVRAHAGAQKARLTLATDLDGTLLAGSAEDRERLTSALAAARTIFVTGRGLETVRPLLLDSTLPRPAFIIADVGATVVEVEAGDFIPVEALQSRIETLWPGAHLVLERLARFGRLVPQRVPQARRCSYLIDDLSAVTPELEASVRELGCDLLVSAGRYLDVLPRGVSKGATLSALAEHLEIERREIVVAGDTLNDLSMFLAGFSGVVVRNAEPKLVEQLKGRGSVHFARSEGAAGILEALAVRGLAEPRPLSVPSRPAEERQLVMVYHRLPSDRKQSPNGIIPALTGLFGDGRPGTWIGWSIQEDAAGLEDGVSVSPEYPGLTASPISLARSDVERFYQRFSKEALWPVLFSFPSHVEISQAGWEHYVHVNRLFAERAAREASRGALVWIHDYNLWMVPHFLRELRPDLRIAFFHHTAFPSADVFNILPWRQKIIGSLLSCDYIGFHIPRYVESFVDVVASDRPSRVVSRTCAGPRFLTHGCALSVGSTATEIEVDGRSVGLGAHPVGIDVARIRSLLHEPTTLAQVAELRRQLAGCTAVLSVERLDYVKGPLQKVDAFERLLETRPDLHGKIVFVNIVTPPISGMTVHDELGKRLDLAVGRINRRFGSMTWTPVRYFGRSLPFKEVVAYYAASDVAWVTPLRDGLNLVAKEYVAVQSALGGHGALILSELAGAAVELHGALLTNPYDPAGMLDTLSRALSLAPAERRERLSRLSQIVEHNDVHRWGERFVQAALSGAP